MSTSGSLAIIHAHWAQRFQCPVEALLRPRVAVLPVTPSDDWYGIYILQHAKSCLISVPGPLRHRVEQAVAGEPVSAIMSVDFARALFDESLETVIGPAWLGYADSRDFRPASTSGVRLLTTDDAQALKELAEACQDDWQLSGITPQQTSVYGRYSDGALVAAGMVVQASSHILNVGIVTHPAHRGRGHGKAVVGALTRLGLNQGSIMQYRTLHDNLPSMSIARSLGYQPYGSTLAIRLRCDDSTPQSFAGNASGLNDRNP